MKRMVVMCSSDLNSNQSNGLRGYYTPAEIRASTPLPAKLPPEHHDRQVGVQIGIVLDAAVGLGVQGDRLVDLDLLIAAELLEVGDGKETDVGRVVPAIALERADPGVRPRPAADRVRERENVSALTRSRPWVIAPRTRTSGGMTG